MGTDPILRREYLLIVEAAKSTVWWADDGARE
jgi:hypothetical protein